VRVLRSVPARKFESLLPGRSVPWTAAMQGRHEVFETVTSALAAARRYIYIEDQYLGEEVGGRRAFELYPSLRAAIRRGVHVVLLGSGIRDPDDPGLRLRPINRRLNRDLRHKVLDRLTEDQRHNLVVSRVEHATVHAKIVLVDDVFACIGSANMFSRSMAGIDREMSAAVQTSSTLVRDLRVRLWAEHVRTPMTQELQQLLAELDVALGIWDPRWASPGDSTRLRAAFDRARRAAATDGVLRRVGR
jgi:phosphatidylserine/phosphatidylglycerophosphate/cardiolipin synthase-like enzyme